MVNASQPVSPPHSYEGKPHLAPASQPDPSKRRFVCPALTAKTWCCIKFETLSGDNVYEYTRKACKAT
ncbi:hypothetical protein PGT21_033682 [Puccinia graminis f. sp. tritici]|uniref:Uncharacterized protein n=1 Tax=Puccinia graminis f. sp. tritici TaxID=56615 RepID=A0A5B0LLN4_PUCGR|nr:hypothetical protein PGTUg99_015798 [Puccinia graminis f. sp. tritici]KAA1094969.1 hypothetical protein PGT21_033682 [Puccinia graminis f. sp. tritici]